MFRSETDTFPDHISSYCKLYTLINKFSTNNGYRNRYPINFSEIGNRESSLI